MTAPGALAQYEPYIISGNYVYISGQIPIENGQVSTTSVGKLGDDFSIEEGQKIAQICAKNLLLQLQNACDNDLHKVKQCVKITIFVNSSADFTDQPLVANAISEMLIEQLGTDKGKHARAAVGVSQLPKGVAVEVDGIFELES